MEDPGPTFDRLRRATSIDARHLSAELSRACWPGGGDRHQPSAAEWLRRWRPERAAAGNRLPICACRTGRCAVCN